MAFFPTNNGQYDNVKDFEYDLCKSKVLNNAYVPSVKYYSQDNISGGHYVENGICYVYVVLQRNYASSPYIDTTSGFPRATSSKLGGSPVRPLYIKNASNASISIGVSPTGNGYLQSTNNIPTGNYEIFGAYEVMN